MSEYGPHGPHGPPVKENKALDDIIYGSMLIGLLVLVAGLTPSALWLISWLLS